MKDQTTLETIFSEIRFQTRNQNFGHTAEQIHGNELCIRRLGDWDACRDGEYDNAGLTFDSRKAIAEAIERVNARFPKHEVTWGIEEKQRITFRVTTR